MQHIVNHPISYLDRILRTVIGFLMTSSAFLLPLTGGWMAGLLICAIYPLLTALTGWDPFYSIIAELKQRFIDYHIFHQ